SPFTPAKVRKRPRADESSLKKTAPPLRIIPAPWPSYPALAWSKKATTPPGGLLFMLPRKDDWSKKSTRPSAGVTLILHAALFVRVIEPTALGNRTPPKPQSEESSTPFPSSVKFELPGISMMVSFGTLASIISESSKMSDESDILMSGVSVGPEKVAISKGPFGTVFGVQLSGSFQSSFSG